MFSRLWSSRQTSPPLFHTEEVKAPSPPPQPKEHLIVDDRETNRMVMGLFLDKLNIPHTHACHGAEALEKCREKDFSFIWMDMKMPHMDGWEFATELRKFNTTSNLVAVSGMDLTPSVRERAQEVGIHRFIQKPLEFGTIAKVYSELSE